ncbi:hypothetical protein niasHT_029180 [Heterodera trifolii]|uniref:C2H2-type domain-containing protein n=1 Tax=Heterodera trifolii TaxID=157864 RepID=A0ABD2JG07_9BILA
MTTAKGQTDAAGMQLRVKRKRKVPLKYRDYFNGVEAEESEDDDLEEQLQPKAVKPTVPENIKPDDHHACPKCPATFDSRVGLTNHLKLHGSDKEFPCELCDFSCTNKKTMRQHRRVHGLSRRRSRLSNTTNVVVKGEFSSGVGSTTAAAGALKFSEKTTLVGGKSTPPQPPSFAAAQWAKQCCVNVNLDILAQRSRNEKVAISSPTTVFKPINSSNTSANANNAGGSNTNFYTNKFCSTVADVARLVNQMHEQQLRNQRKAAEEKEEERRRKNGIGKAEQKHQQKAGRRRSTMMTTDMGDDDEEKNEEKKMDKKNDGHKIDGGHNDGMPILEKQQQQLLEERQQLPQQQQQSIDDKNSKSNITTNGNSTVDHHVTANPTGKSCDNSINVRKSSSSTSSNSGTVAGGKTVYDRNTIQCPHCPFRTQSRQRLEPHLKGHTRTYGFQCSVCGFKNDSSGFIRRHSQLHDVPCHWPPDYVGVPNNEQLLAKLLGGRCQSPTTVSTTVTTNQNDADQSISSLSPPPLDDDCQKMPIKQQSMENDDEYDDHVQQHQHHHDNNKHTVVDSSNGNNSSNSMHKLIKMEMIEFNEDEHDQIVVVEEATMISDNNNINKTNCSGADDVDEDEPVQPTAAVAENKFRWTYQLIADRWHAYQKKCLQIRSSTVHCTSSSSKLLHTSQPPQHNNNTLCLFCRRCQLQFRSGPAHLALHNARHHHRGIDTNQSALLCRELLAERLAWRDDRGDGGIEFEFTPLTSSNGRNAAAEGRRSPSAAASLDGSTTTTTTLTGTVVSKVYRCRNCPFSTDQTFRLQKHESKHLIKSEHQCPHCSFSCRSLDILAQHKRLHDDNTAQCSSSTSNSNNGGASSPTSSSASPASAAQIEQKTTTLAFVPSQNKQQQQQQQQMALSSTRLAPIRRNEAHYCPHCPYSSKHNCDMKAHMRMHEVRSKFACSLCTYSSKRQNALLAHEQLHRKGPLLGSPAVLGPRGAKCRRLKRIILLLHHHQRDHRRHRHWHSSTSASVVPIGERIRFDGACTHFYRCAHRQCREEVPFCADLVRHARNHRTKAALFRCDNCSFSTMLEHRLNAHQLVTHNRYTAGGDESGEEKNSRTDTGIFNCKECPFFTVNYAKFWNHRQKHKRANRFTCKHCSFSSGSVQCYAEHMELHGDTGTTATITSIINKNSGGTNVHTTEFGIVPEAMVATMPKHAAATSTVTAATTTAATSSPPAIQSSPEAASSLDGAQMLSEKKLLYIMPTKLVQEKSDDEEMEMMTTASMSQAVAASLVDEADKSDQQFDVVLQPFAQTKSMLGLGVGSSSSSAVAAAAADFSSASFIATATLTLASQSAKTLCCSECPFETVHLVLLKLHMEMHRNSECRPFTCALCSFGCFSADSLHAHLALHASATTLEGGGNGTFNNESTQQRMDPLPDTPQTAAAGGQINDAPFSAVLNNASAAAAPSVPPTVSMVSSSSLYACSQCNFKCAELEPFLAHRKEHVQLIQQRLMTIIKRAALMENCCFGNGATTIKMDKMPKANGAGNGRTVDKQHYCTRCSFRCDSVQAFTRHWEHHRIDNSRPGIFQCSACDYSSDTRNVVLFHKHNHHLDIPLTSLCKNIELVKEQQKRQSVADEK